MSNTTNLPVDVIAEILARLPVKSLLKFKCVRKSWYSLIKSPNFVDLHLRYASTIEDNYSAILTQPVHDSCIIHVSYLPDNKDPSIDLSDHAPQHIPFFDDFNDELRIIVRFKGSCNGIICVAGDHHTNENRYNIRQGDLIALWNPATREIKRLPLSTISRGNSVMGNTMEVGFGFDPKSKDYKVVRILDYDDGSRARWGNPDDDSSRILRFRPLVEVYSLSSHCWRKIDVVVPTYMRIVLSLSAYLDGFYYWWSGGEECDNHDDNFILTFDFANEVFNKIRPPDLGNPSMVTLVKYKESIALAADETEGGVEGPKFMTLSLWVLSSRDDDGWFKLYKVRRPGDQIVGYFSNGYHVECYCYMNGGTEDEDGAYTEHYEQDEYCHLIMYDPTSQQVVLTETYDMDTYDVLELQLVNYVQSLVSFN